MTAAGGKRAGSLALDREGDGGPLVLLHGVGTNRGVWRRVVPLLAPSREVVAVDLPGFGDSPAAGEGFELDAVADRIAEALSPALGGRFDLVGHSLGGAVALTVAHRYPELVRRLVLVAPAGLRAFPRRVAGVLGHTAPAALAARRLVGRPLVANPTLRRLVLWGPVADASRLEREDALFVLEASKRASRLGEAIEAVAGADLRDELAELAVPLGLVWGEQDRVVPPAGIETILELRPGTPVERVADAGHILQLEQPAAFAKALERLLERIPRGLEPPLAEAADELTRPPAEEK